ncbi:hypothetical protein MCUN1_000888 [Malassezia cuniculi]|uniref:Uncharacterized protein n=1 Tax=Malassezia cuniculi TaxID=948313 RepID=A0AAF0EPR0_9BASI|nr:hypothetical protein MCUN1_000888 [Malassezia cuniculi]
MPSALRMPVAVFAGTAADIAVQHVLVTVLCRSFARLPLLLPSMALLFARVSTLILSVLLLIWDSELPEDRARHLHLPLGDITVETTWVARVLIGGMAAGVSLGVVMPQRPMVAVSAVLIAGAAQFGTSHVMSLRED